MTGDAATPSHRKLRGSGIRQTLPYLLRFSGLWLAVTIPAVVVVGVLGYLTLSPVLDGAQRHALAWSLVLQTSVGVLAILVLAAFTTHRIAGPWIAVRRALRTAREGDLGTPLVIRRQDRYLQELADEYNALLASVRERLAEGREGQGGLETGRARGTDPRLG